MYVYLIPLATIFVATVAGAAERPNILFVIADDCTFRDLGSYGGQAYTPNLDRLVAEGIKFNACFQTAPMCSPTRHTVYTGLYPVKSGAWPNHTFAYPHVKSVVHYLRPLGYRVALSGKVHVAPKSVFPFEYSGKRAKGEKGSVIDFKAIESLFAESASQRTPFALFACSNEPHSPWNKGKQHRSRYDADRVRLPPRMVDTPSTRKEFVNYLAEISFFDGEVGRLLDLLEDYGHADNTLVMVVSEQGNSFPFAKWSCYDAGLQSAMVVRWPGRVAPGSQSDALVEYVDILPTFVEAVGGEAVQGLDGKSFVGVLEGVTDEHKQHVFGLQTTRGIFKGPDHYGIRSIRDREYKLVLNLDPNATFFNTINHKRWFGEWRELAESGDEHARRVVESFAKRPQLELYNVTKDPHELNNLCGDGAHAARIAGMEGRLREWMDSQGDEGMKTEMAAYTRMLGGNDAYKAWAEQNGKPGP